MTESNQTSPQGGTGLSDAERLRIRTEVQADAARATLGRARDCLAEKGTPDDWPGRAGSLGFYVSALADELDRALDREQEWAAAALSDAQREVLRQALHDAVAWATQDDRCHVCEQSPTGLCPDHQAELDRRNAYIALAHELGIEVQS